MFRPSDTPNCESTDLEAFFVQDGSGTYADVRLLQRICSTCVVKVECLNYALKHEVLGYWGNTNELQRRRIRREKNIQSIPLYNTYN
jgi:WhiB family transcriptional regulator, redox-sensing transcriptional regulator